MTVEFFRNTKGLEADPPDLAPASAPGRVRSIGRWKTAGGMRQPFCSIWLRSSVIERKRSVPPGSCASIEPSE
jgi:hypothetical protein